MGRSRYRVLEDSPHFLTCTVVNWLPLFSQPQLVQIILDSLQFLQDKQRLTLHAYVIMENHLHLIASSENLPKAMQTFKSFTAREIIDTLVKNKSYWLSHLQRGKSPQRYNQDYQLWQEGYHPQVIQNQQILQQKVEYIHANPVRRGYVDDPSHWRYSSDRTYQGQPGLLAIEMLR
ncbi:MAG: transposase [Phormidium sp. BM_Day4_Bin.17]|nr:transposase [Phormidium sp. BM_Day4_Bin.17]UCJ14091.1 MAG: transposase [Phormidium sp. PBR-2020]